MRMFDDQLSPAAPGIALAGAVRAAGRPQAETMNPLKENRPGETDEHAGTHQGNTMPAQGEAQKPRLPHEHDESADSQDGQAADRAGTDRSQQAFADVARGLVDTDRRSAYENPQIAGRLDRRNVERRKQPRR